MLSIPGYEEGDVSGKEREVVGREERKRERKMEKETQRRKDAGLT